MEKLIIIGDSGHAKVITDIAESSGFNIVAVLDDKFKDREERSVIYGPIKYVHDVIAETEGHLIIAIGNNEVRRNIIEHYDLSDDLFTTLISPAAHVSQTAKIGAGTVVMPGAIVNADAIIGKQAIINSGAIVEHDNQLGDFCHLSPNATATGGVVIGEGVHIGAGAVINPLVRIGKWSIIGSGAVVISNIESYATATGVPARIIKLRGHRL
ncbi:acetyltransferase [Macrococcus lamae]|uniref:Acetyltransferase n=1 Tax=Macrococcus lamae TaxID=198484 RepID=A0A4R6BVK5_9STAP|nr:acetyltransferase [Macrococcus lamae]TDM12391.1 acetyltransferase [Macrococcus lamae]